ncbi:MULTISPECIES: hypothetical protein [Pseudoalteromonas]|uniref:Uncharacterized protein n=1 Tax=Pseudoalteromonas obscura TaxID=3048491 RepID=A0ABT7EGG7_9GAMM|nr:MULTISPECIES: hypothetical protein [Pseudoalteromonas]MBQ4835617.1 hypothetical protein [Pseudoalteromonas luteoviolacea]MDK2594132.1 hypothetical protein [Pseudoalteromonas sp. P94(2023)]
MISKKVLCAVSLTLLSFNSLAVMDLAEYQHRAYTETGRCVVDYPNYLLAINYAQQNGLITASAARWARATGYYPVIGFWDRRIHGVCRQKI